MENFASVMFVVATVGLAATVLAGTATLLARSAWRRLRPAKAGH